VKSTANTNSGAATTRSTAGTGFDFEDKVAAWLLLQMLSGAPLPGIKVRGERLRWQTKAIGYELDDLLVSGQGAGEYERSLAISCKSNRQVSRNGLPKDFVQAAWRQRQSRVPAVTRANVALASRGRVASFAEPWSDIKTWVAAPPDVALPRVQASGKHQVIFDGAVSAIQELSREATPEGFAEFLKVVEVLPFDFQHVPSNDESEAIGACAKLIASGTLADAQSLWQALLECSKNQRLGGGSIDLWGLIEELRSKVDLREHPNFAGSWRQLTSLTEDATALISGKLPTGHIVERQELVTAIGQSIDRDVITVVSGASGGGKSAIVKHVIGTRFPKHRLIWLRADSFRIAAQEATRTRVGVSQPLIDVLRASNATRNILVIDACERLDEDGISLIRKLLDGIVPIGREPSETAWKVVAIGQPVVLEQFASVVRRFAPGSDPIDVGPLEPTEVRVALLGEPRLSWMADDQATLDALSNLKTLAWVIESAAAFSSEGSRPEPVSPTFIIDRLWSRWTGDRRPLSAILIRLAERDAQFEPPPVESEIATLELEQLEKAPAARPFFFDERGQLVFQHDLAADWARYQRLVELSKRPAQWVELAANPRWHAAFRFLAQRLLRQPTDDGFSTWDQIFREFETTDGPLSRVCDLLLDGLYLDPSSEQWLEQRSVFLLEQKGLRLLRLLERFHHLATRPSSLASAAREDIRLHLEASLRVPIPRHWPALVRFLEKHTDAIADLHATEIAKICKTWLGSVPAKTSAGQPFPLRMELARLALSTARSLQRAQETEQFFICNAETAIYEAAFAAANDLPDKVAQWALEMARRRPWCSDIVAESDVRENERREREKERLDNDPEWRERVKTIQHSSLGFLEPKKLPPWPNGPKDRIERRFRHVLLQNATVVPLMIATPKTAADLLLAGIIEDNPLERRGDHWMLDLSLGLAEDSEAYPPAHWKSPFHLFLKLNRSEALNCLITLVNFCTERWHDAVGASGTTGVQVWNDELEVERFFSGNADVYDWTFQGTPQTTQLASALMALEQWLREACEKADDVEPAIKQLMSSANSIAVIGVLAAVGKAHPKLFKGPLRSLLLTVDLVRIDEVVAKNGIRIFPDDWIRYGEQIWDAQRSWQFADFRKLSLRDIAVSECEDNEVFRAEFIASLDLWRERAGELELETEFWLAELDPRNRVRDEAGDWKTNYPAELASRVEAQVIGEWADTQYMTLPQRCFAVLNSEGALSLEDGKYLAGYIQLDAPENVQPESLERAQVAAAATLLIKPGKWLSQQDKLKEACEGLLCAVIDGLDEGGQRLPFPTAMYHPHPQLFAITAITSLWIQNVQPEKWEPQFVKILTSYNPSVISLATQIAHGERERLGERWYRIQDITLLWSAILALRPRYEPESDQKWGKWRDRIRRCRITGVPPNARRSLLELAERNERLMRRRVGRQVRECGKAIEELDPNRHFGWGMDDGVLEAASTWALRDEVETSDVEAVRDRLLEIWTVERWRLTARPERDSRLPHKLGLDVLACLAKLLPRRDSGADTEIWQPILSNGGRR
jgi:hypothetical protein